MKKYILGAIFGIFITLAGTVVAYNSYFRDVPAGQWYTPHIEALRDVGVVSGYPDGSFQPGKTVTRAEVSVMMSKLLMHMGDPSIICEVGPDLTDSGRPETLVSNKYPKTFVGAVFTADDCSNYSMGGNYMALQSVFGVETNEDPKKYRYTLGSQLYLKAAPSAGMLAALRAVGFTCSKAGIAEASCTEWKLTGTVLVTDILKLKPYAPEILRDDCVSCG